VRSKIFRFGRAKMLEIPVNPAHLRGQPIFIALPSMILQPRDFVCDLFTISGFPDVIESC
jgi:hypothetical protein